MSLDEVTLSKFRGREGDVLSRFELTRRPSARFAGCEGGLVSRLSDGAERLNQGDWSLAFQVINECHQKLGKPKN